MPPSQVHLASDSQAGASGSHILIGMEFGGIADETLRFFAQIGVEAVGMPLRESAPAGTAPHSGALELSWAVSSHSLAAVSGNILLGRPGRDDDLEIVKANIATTVLSTLREAT